ncbi:MAG: hypothetical protein JWP44_2708 [Mucilaginibacter sp.]|nr:hypothetical protein [Mucilaginibacter sp.]
MSFFMPLWVYLFAELSSTYFYVPFVGYPSRQVASKRGIDTYYLCLQIGCLYKALFGTYENAGLYQ